MQNNLWEIVGTKSPIQFKDNSNIYVYLFNEFTRREVSCYIAGNIVHNLQKKGRWDGTGQLQD